MKKKITMIVMALFSINAFSVEWNDNYIKKINDRINEINEKLIRIKNKKIDLDDTSNALANDFVANVGGDQLLNAYISGQSDVGHKYSLKHPQFRSITLDFLDKFTDRIENLRPEFKRVFQENRKKGIGIAETTRFLMDAHMSNIENLEEFNEFQLNIEDIVNNKKPRFTKEAKRRESAKNDVVAQVLNYSFGVAEDASGAMFIYPENTRNGQCFYKIAISEGSMTGELADMLSQANRFISGLGIPELDNATRATSTLDNGVDLNKGNLKNINFYKLQGAKRNKFTGVTAYLRYQTRIEGIPDIFECDSNNCSIERLKRGWDLVSTKCAGTKKAF